MHNSGKNGNLIAEPSRLPMRPIAAHSRFAAESATGITISGKNGNCRPAPLASSPAHAPWASARPSVRRHFSAASAHPRFPAESATKFEIPAKTAMPLPSSVALCALCGLSRFPAKTATASAVSQLLTMCATLPTPFPLMRFGCVYLFQRRMTNAHEQIER